MFPVLLLPGHDMIIATVHGHQVRFELALSEGTLGFGCLVFKPLRLLLASFSPNCSDRSFPKACPCFRVCLGVLTPLPHTD